MSRRLTEEFNALGRIGAEGKLEGRRAEYWEGFPGNVRSVQGSITSEGGSITLGEGNEGSYVRITSGSAVNCTVPPASTYDFPIGTQIIVVQGGAGQVTIVAGSGVTINTPSGLLLSSQYSGCTLTKIATNEWDIIGDLTT